MHILATYKQKKGILVSGPAKPFDRRKFYYLGRKDKRLEIPITINSVSN